MRSPPQHRSSTRTTTPSSFAQAPQTSLEAAELAETVPVASAEAAVASVQAAADTPDMHSFVAVAADKILDFADLSADSAEIEQDSEINPSAEASERKHRMADTVVPVFVVLVAIRMPPVLVRGQELDTAD